MAIPNITPENHVLQEIVSSGKKWNVLIVPGGEYRAATSIGMIAALRDAGITPEDFEHIVVISSGVFAWLGFVTHRVDQILKYAKQGSPSDTIHMGSGRFDQRKALKTWQLLGGMLLPDPPHIHDDGWDERSFVARQVLPPDYAGPIVHVVTTDKTTGDPVYIRSDTSDPEKFQVGLIATMGVPGWSPVPRINGQSLVDGVYSDGAGIQYALRELGAKRLVILGNKAPQQYLRTPKPVNDMVHKFTGFVFGSEELANLWNVRRPADQFEQHKLLVDRVKAWAVKVFFPHPQPGVLENPLLTTLGPIFYVNTLLGYQACVDAMASPYYQLPDFSAPPPSLAQIVQRLPDYVHWVGGWKEG